MSQAGPGERVDTLVIGAGISGLAFAQALGDKVDVLVLDGAERAGGWLQSESVAVAPGARFEVGAEALADPQGNLAALCTACGIETIRAPASAQRRYLVHRGELVALPSSPQGMLTTPLLSASGKLRALTELFRDRRVALEGSIADFVRHRFGREVLEAFVDPFVSGVHGGDPELVSLRAAFPALAAMVEEHGSVLRGMSRRKKSKDASLFKPRGGMQRLPEGLARKLGSRLRLRTVVSELARSGDGFVATTSEGPIHARRAVVATDRARAVLLLSKVAPLASRELAGMSAENLVAVIHGWDRGRVAHPLDGFGFLAASSQGLATLGTLFSSTIDPECAPEGQVVLRTLLGGARRAALVDESDERLIASVLLESSKLLGIAGAPRWTRVLRYRGAIPRYDLDHPRRVAAIEADVARVPGLAVLGNAITGPGVGALVARATELARHPGKPG
ncbi:MAG TPA: protoporphyrinogen oxidase [Planctomycetota bacterium]|nr:protoporphyrinogen oxidase [Planctomycetota bacterium]